MYSSCSNFVHSTIYFLANSTVHSYKTRQSDQLHLLISNGTEYDQRYLNYKGCTLWNNLPRTLQEIANTRHFKKQIKNYLIDI